MIEDIANLSTENLSGVRIRSDLSITRLSCLGRFFWKVGLGYFECTRRLFYGIDLRETIRKVNDIATSETAPSDEVVNKCYCILNDRIRKIKSRKYKEQLSLALNCILQEKNQNKVDALRISCGNISKFAPSLSTVCRDLRTAYFQTLPQKEINRKAVNIIRRALSDGFDKIPERLKTDILAKATNLGVNFIAQTNPYRPFGESNDFLTDDFIEQVVTLCPNLEKVDLVYCPRNMTEIYYPCKVTDRSFTLIGQLQHLKYLDLQDSHCPITDDTLALFSNLTELTHLDLTKSPRVTGTGLSHLKELPNLCWLRMMLCAGITDGGMAAVAQLTGLQHLFIGGVDAVTDTGLLELGKLKFLNRLEFSFNNNVTNDGFSFLKECLHLKSLRGVFLKKITHEVLIHLFHLKELTSLDLTGCSGVSSAFLEYLKTLPKLEQIKCAGTGASREHLDAFLAQQQGNIKTTSEFTPLQQQALDEIGYQFG